MGLASKLAAAQAAQNAQSGGGYPQQQQYGQQSQQQQPGSYGQAPPAQQQQKPQQSQYPSQQQYGSKVGYGAVAGVSASISANISASAGVSGAQIIPAGTYGQGQQGQQGQYGRPPQQQSQQVPPKPPQVQLGQQGQQGQYGRPPQQQPQGGASCSNFLQILQSGVQENRLNAFYQADKLQRISGSLAPKIDNVCGAWRIPREIGIDLARLALYDIIIYADDSGSMSFEENGERIDDLKLILSRAAYIASLFDDNGIQVRFMNNTVEGNNLINEQQVTQLINQVQFRGLTPLGTNLRNKVIEPLVLGPVRAGRLEKPVLVLTITDGSPAGEPENTIFDVISRTKYELDQSRYGGGACAFQFAQVGSDLKAREFLGRLDTDPVVGGNVDCTSSFEVEQDEMMKLGVNLDPATWLVKMLLGAIDSSYDDKDEKRRG